MINYNEYINELKKARPEIDYDRMYSEIDGRLARRPFKPALAVAGALAVIFIVFTAYYGLRAQSDDMLFEYVFDQEEIGGNTLVSYVFEN